MYDGLRDLELMMTAELAISVDVTSQSSSCTQCSPVRWPAAINLLKRFYRQKLFVDFHSTPMVRCSYQENEMKEPIFYFYFSVDQSAQIYYRL
jgi:hypothetical protein